MLIHTVLTLFVQLICTIMFDQMNTDRIIWKSSIQKDYQRKGYNINYYAFVIIKRFFITRWLYFCCYKMVLSTQQHFHNIYLIFFYSLNNLLLWLLYFK